VFDGVVYGDGKSATRYHLVIIVRPVRGEVGNGDVGVWGARTGEPGPGARGGSARGSCWLSAMNIRTQSASPG